MEGVPFSPQLMSWLDQGHALFIIIHVLGIVAFGYIVWRRLIPLLRAQRDLRFDHPLARLGNVFKYWLGPVSYTHLTLPTILRV